MLGRVSSCPDDDIVVFCPRHTHVLRPASAKLDIPRNLMPGVAEDGT